MKFKNVSIKWKILFAVAVGPLIVAAILAWMRVNDIRQGAEEALLDKSQAIVFMAEAAREEMGRKLNSGLIPPFGSVAPR